ncbi:MAG TPA: trypsin-like peptidase domain-containing protein [Ktedonobacterales bacterium]
MFTDYSAGASTPSGEPAPEIQAGVPPIPEAHPYGTEQSVTPYPPTQTGGVVDAAGQRTPWMTDPYGVPPGLPPTYGGETGGGRPNRRRAPWHFVLVVLALVLTLAGGVAIGRASAAQQTGTTSTLGSSSAPVVNVSSNVKSLEQTVQTVAKAVAPSVVEITSTGNGQEGIGSGDVLTKDGYIVTNDHVVQGFTNFTVTLSDGTKLPAQLIGQDPQDDLAVVKVSATNLQPISFADSSKLTVGQFAIAIGNPYGLRETATFGDVSALNRTASESPNGPASILTGLVQTSAPIAPGNSGGALVNLQGQLIGIPTLGQSDQQSGPGSSSTTSIGLAIPSNQVKTVAQQLIQGGHVTSTNRGFLGIQGEDVTPDVANASGLTVQSGVLIKTFVNDAAGQSPAQQAGLQSGDVIVAVDGQTISDSSDLASAVATQAPGKQVQLTVVRGSSHLTINVTLGERPANT